MRNLIESISSIGSGSGGAGLLHSFTLTMITIKASATTKPVSNMLSFIMVANLTINSASFLLSTILNDYK